MSITVTLPYEDYSKLVKDSADKENVIKVLKTEFPDDTCQIIAVKSILGIVEEDTPEEPSETPEDGEATDGE